MKYFEVEAIIILQCEVRVLGEKSGRLVKNRTTEDSWIPEYRR